MAVQIESSVVQNAPGITIDPSVSLDPISTRTRCLCRFEDGEVFAYADRGHEFIRASDRELWAVERDNELVSARSGAVLAQRRGRVYFGADTDEPLYYERAI
jgi:hypothetical protein